MKIRPFQQSDCDAVLRLYRRQAAGLPFHHNVRRDQFRTDLFTNRFIRNPADHHDKAQIALVATHNKQVRALVSGGLVLKGDEVVESRTGYVGAIIAEAGAAAELKELLPRVVAHLRRYRPKKIVAFDGCLCPMFFADGASTLPARWAWIGQCLLDTGFAVSGRSLRLAARLDQPRRQVLPPRELKLLHVPHDMYGFDPKYDFGCVLLKAPYQYGDGVVWCGNFYSGMFVKVRLTVRCT